MRILLDENPDWRLRRFLPEHELDSVSYIGSVFDKEAGITFLGRSHGTLRNH